MKHFLSDLPEKRGIVALALGATVFALNGLRVPVFGDTEIMVGGWAALLAIYWLGPWWGSLATALAFSQDWLVTGPPWALVCFTLEAVVVGWLQHRRNWHPLLAAAAYWPVVGIPVAVLALTGSGGTLFPNNWGLVAKLPCNSLLLALAAFPLFQSRWFCLRVGLPLDRETDTPLRRVLFQHVGIILALPIAVLSLFRLGRRHGEFGTVDTVEGSGTAFHCHFPIHVPMPQPHSFTVA